MSYVVTGFSLREGGALTTAPPEQAHTSQLVIDHMRLAEAVARRHSFGSCDPADMRQVAYMGLVKAAQRFNPERGTDFAAYAAPTIAGECKRYLRDSGWVVRPPRAVQDLRHQVAIQSARVAQELGHEPDAAELANALDESPQAIREGIAAQSSMRPTSLSHVDPQGDRVGPAGLGGSLGSDPFELIESSDAIARACATLTERDKRVLHLRFVEEKTQAEIGAELGVTQMQVSRILRRITTELRSHLQGC